MGFWSRVAKSTTSGGSSASSSSSSASSAGLRTPEWGPQAGVRLAGDHYVRSNVYQGFDETWHDVLDAKKGKLGQGDWPQSPSAQFLELPAPPPLLLPLPLLAQDETPAPMSSRKASPRSGSVDTILASDSSRTASLRDHTPTSACSEVSASCLSDEIATSTTPVPQATMKQPPSKRRKRGRSRSIHLLWRSQVDAQAWDALRDYYHWSTGESWPDGGGLAFWDEKMGNAGL